MRTSAELVCSVTSLTRLSWRWLCPPLLLSFRPVAARPAWYSQTSRKTTSHEGWLRCRCVYHQIPTHLSRAPSQDRTPLLGFDEEQTRTAPCPSPFPPWHSACLTRGSVQKGAQGKVGVGWTGSTTASSTPDSPRVSVGEASPALYHASKAGHQICLTSRAAVARVCRG